MTGRVLDVETKKPIPNVTVLVTTSLKGVVGNQLGYFGLELGPLDFKVKISSIGYVSMVVNVLPNEFMKVSLTRNYDVLSALDLISFQAVPTLPLPEDATPSTSTNSTEGEVNASYKGGWEYFYNQFALNLQRGSRAEEASDFIRKIRFTIDEKGNLKNLEVYPSILWLHELVAGALTDLVNWTPASQQGMNVPEHFELPLRFEEEIFKETQEASSPVGGMMKFGDFIQSNMKYTRESTIINEPVSGKMIADFVVNLDSSITDVRILNRIGLGLDEELIRILSSSKWIPGTINGQPVKQRVILSLGLQIETLVSRLDFYQLLRERLRYPQTVISKGLSGWAYVKFNLNRTTGEIHNISTIPEAGNEFSGEVKTILRSLPPQSFIDLQPRLETLILPVAFRSDNAIPPIDRKLLAQYFGQVLGTITVSEKDGSRPLKDPRSWLFITKEPNSEETIGLGYYPNFEAVFAEKRNLRTVSIVNRGIVEVPPQIANLRNLESLNLERNKIATLPPEVTELKKLKELYLPANKINQLPFSFGGLQSLRILALSFNQFEDFPAISMPKLIVLDLSNNRLSSIPESIGALRNLEFLYLQNNRIETLPESLFKMTKLKRLNLKGNSLRPEDKQRLKEMLKNTRIIF